MKRLVPVLTVFTLLFSAIANAESQTYLDCTMGEGADKQGFTVQIDTERSEVTHSSDAHQFKASAFFKPETLTYKRSIPGRGIAITQTFVINRETLDLHVEFSVRSLKFPDKIPEKRNVTTGTCSVAKEVDTKF